MTLMNVLVSRGDAVAVHNDEIHYKTLCKTTADGRGGTGLLLPCMQLVATTMAERIGWMETFREDGPRLSP